MKVTMTRCAAFVLWILSLCATGIVFAATPAPDLEPEEGVFGFGDDPYKATVAEFLLGAEKYRKCQMVFLPSFDKESAVYILRKDDRQEAKATVVSVEMKRQLWGEMMKFLEKEAGGKSYSVGPKAERRALEQVSREVRHTQAEIDARTASILERTWEGMLSRVRYPTRDVNVRGMDGESFYAAHFVRGAGYSTGKTWSPDKGTRTHDFVELAKALRNFTQSAVADREAVLRDVVAKAEALLERLNRDK